MFVIIADKDGQKGYIQNVSTYNHTVTTVNNIEKASKCQSVYEAQDIIAVIKCMDISLVCNIMEV